MGWFSDRIVEWQRAHGRHDLPWQGTRDPYRIWVSEIMLQQTQVAAVIPYYLRFVARLPDVHALAAAAPDEVMRLWSGLGYYSRARNLHGCAQRVVADFGGRFPRSADALADLPGIGRSTGAAIAAFAFGERVAILDGNVKRVLCRFEAVEGYPGAGPVERRLWEIADRELPDGEIEAYTQGLMDLGATLCSRSRPACGQCPLSERCVASAEGRTAELPTRKPRRVVPVRETTMLVLRRGDEVCLERRPPTGIWGGLWSLPEWPVASPESVAGMLEARFGLAEYARTELPPFEHAFTHFRLRVRALLLDVGARAAKPPGAAQQGAALWLPLTEVDGAALPRPVKSLLQRLRDREGDGAPRPAG
jgi:A/G-specific adenine glycosylase